jgi:ketosteroid isomerase-like protein
MRQTVERPGAEPMTRYARFLVTMQRGSDGAWRIIGDASMRAEEAQWTALTRTEGLHFDA